MCHYFLNNQNTSIFWHSQDVIPVYQSCIISQYSHAVFLGQYNLMSPHNCFHVFPVCLNISPLYLHMPLLPILQDSVYMVILEPSGCFNLRSKGFFLWIHMAFLFYLLLTELLVYMSFPHPLLSTWHIVCTLLNEVTWPTIEWSQDVLHRGKN